MIDETVSISEFFKEQLLEALEDQRVETSDLATGYLLSLLEELAAPDKARMPDLLHHTLVELMTEAQQLQGSEQAQRWRTMGDAVLVATGIYRGSILKRGMDLNYYFLMGASAYRRAAAMHKILGGASIAELCKELGIKLPKLSDVFEQIMANVSLQGDQGLVLLLDRWHKDHATWVRKMLNRRGLKLPGGKQ